jgi:MSHA biogenesis protein MshQ
MTYGATYRWYVNVTDGTHWTRKLFSFETGYPSQFDPFEFGWHYRKQITIDHTQVLDDLTNFPVLVSTSDTDLSQKAQVDGGDILFMNNIGESTRLFHDLESYDASSGTLVAWVNILYLSSSDDTTFYMYYGNPTCINQQNPSKVWGSDYRMIHHFEESSGNIIDSTDNEFDGVISGSVTYGAEGKIGRAMLFIDANALINGITTSGNTFTISAWVKHGSDSNWKSIIDSLHGRVVFALYQGKVQYYDTEWRDSGLSYSTMVWNYVVISKSGTDITFFVNGIQTTNTGVNCNIGGTTRIGSSYDFDSTARFHGTIDELEVSIVARTNAWISTSYQNQNDPAVFLIIGPEESGP